jgi:F-type H+-transporting ATPase subunit epsilon
MSATYRYSVETPDGVAAGGECDFLVLPTANGEVGVLAGHAPLLADIVPGALRITHAGTDSRITVGHGVAEVRSESVHLFVASASVAAPGTSAAAAAPASPAAPAAPASSAAR